MIPRRETQIQLSSRPAGCLRAALAFLLFLLAVSPAAAQTDTEVILDSSPQLFAVLCAARAAALDSAAARPSSAPVVSRIDAALARLNPAVVAPLRTFFQEKHRRPAPDDLSAYVSLALMVEPPPDFSWAVPRDQLPPDVWELQDFVPLLRTFYVQANLEGLWRDLRSAYEDALTQRQPEVAQLLLETRAYLRLVGERYPGRGYAIYVDWLVPPALTSARNYGENYFLVIHPQRGDFLDAVRHQYLHFVLDPLMLKHAEQFSSWSALMPVAGRAPRLPSAFREDVLLLATESLVQAMEIRRQRLAPEQADREVNTRERAGYLFTRHFFEALLNYEQDEPSLRFYFPELFRSFDVNYERARLERVEFSPAVPAAERAEAHAPSPAPAANPTGQLLAEAERHFAAGDYAAAREAFERVLREASPTEPRALYGLALVASAEQDRVQAKDYFLRTLEHARDPRILGWTHVYLGRIYDLEGDRKEALAHYRAALALNTRLERVEQAARRGLERPFGTEEEPVPPEQP